MFAWTWEFCLPDLICFGLTMIIVGWMIWVWAEQGGWNEGFLDGADLRDFGAEEKARKRVSDGNSSSNSTGSK
jgi:hypothetical protein